MILRPPNRGVAQPGSAPALGAGSRRFKSSRPDQTKCFKAGVIPGFFCNGKYLMSDKSDSKDINIELSSADKIIEEIISELPMKERVAIANMNKEDIEILKNVFNKYVRGKTDTEVDDSEYTNIMNNLWEKLRQTHKLRVVK